jgi:hypothetical protein
VFFCTGSSLPTQEAKNGDVVSSEGSGQSTTFADEKAVFGQTRSRRSITLLPSGINAPRREISLKLHGLDEPPPAHAFIGWEIGSGLVLRESVEIRAPALKEMDALAHRSLLLRQSGQLWQRIRSSHLNNDQGRLPSQIPISSTPFRPGNGFQHFPGFLLGRVVGYTSGWDGTSHLLTSRI